MITGLNTRSKLVSLVVTALAIAAEDVTTEKLDTVDTFPGASVYLRPMVSAPAAMGGVRQRLAVLAVAVFRETAEPDIAPQLAADQLAFEAAVEESRKGREFEGLEGIWMVGAEIDLVPDSNQKKGVLVMTFEAQYTEKI